MCNYWGGDVKAQEIKEASGRGGEAPDVFDGGSLQRVHLQHEHEQRGHRASQVLWDVEDASSDLLKQRGDMLIIKGQSAAQQGIQDHPTAPDVHLWACIEPDADVTQRSVTLVGPLEKQPALLHLLTSIIQL